MNNFTRIYHSYATNLRHHKNTNSSPNDVGGELSVIANESILQNVEVCNIQDTYQLHQQQISIVFQLKFNSKQRRNAHTFSSNMFDIWYGFSYARARVTDMGHG